tara:strand:+ start:2919 stop:3548 length:630 start_codon:yes stop_codon:yes gene_type:complete
MDFNIRAMPRIIQKRKHFEELNRIRKECNFTDDKYTNKFCHDVYLDYSSTNKSLIVTAPRRCGKTLALLSCAIETAISNPTKVLVCVAPNRGMRDLLLTSFEYLCTYRGIQFESNLEGKYKTCKIEDSNNSVFFSIAHEHLGRQWPIDYLFFDEFTSILPDHFLSICEHNITARILTAHTPKQGDRPESYDEVKDRFDHKLYEARLADG